jgi:hypothetical protein
VKALAYGSSIPHIDVADLKAFQVVRLRSKEEAAIADLAEEAASLRAKADLQERALASAAEKLIGQFVAGEMSNFMTTMRADDR